MRCCCATAARPPTPPGSTTATTCPRLIRAGRHIARTKRYIRNYAHEVEPAELAAYVAQEAQRGDGWVKLVGDWIDRDTGDLEPSFPADAFAEAIAAAHEHGAKVTAHCFGEAVLPGLIDAGIDCIEHGTGLSEDLIDEMVARTALVPTVMQLNNFPDYADAAGEKFPAYAEHMRDLHGRRRDTIMAAYEAGVAIYAGTDAGGVLPARHHRRRGAGAGRLRLQPEATPSVPRPGGRGSGWGSTAGSPRAPRPTSWSTTATPSRTCRCSPTPKRIVLRGNVVGERCRLTSTPTSSTRSGPRGACSPRRRPRCSRPRRSRRRDLELMLARRVAGEPLEQVVGWAEFCGLRIVVAPGVFVPRRRTEMLVDLAVAILVDDERPVVVDLCCGTGAIGVAIADAADQAGAARGRPGSRRGRVCPAQRDHGRGAQGDLYDALPARPGRPGRRTRRERAVRAHRRDRADAPRGPRRTSTGIALDGGPDGLDVHRRVAAGAPPGSVRAARC